MASISAFAISSSFIFLILFSSASLSKYFISAFNLAALAAALIFLERAEELDNFEDFVLNEPLECEDLTDDFSSKAFFSAAWIRLLIFKCNSLNSRSIKSKYQYEASLSSSVSIRSWYCLKA